MHTTITTLLGSLCFLLFWTCSSNKLETQQAASPTTVAYVKDVPQVDTSHVQSGYFHQEIISNGKLQAIQKASLSFDIRARITDIYVQNGQRVQKGQTLAILENFSQKLAFEQAQQGLEKARTNLQDALIGYGYSGKDSSGVPVQIYRAAQTKSGYLQAKSTLKKAHYELQQTTLTAPFSGVIANLSARSHNASDLYNPFCILLDNHAFEVDFQLLETELSLVQKDALVEIIPFSLPNTSYTAKIQQINPLIDENGMIQAIARIRRRDKELISGMNVKVLISKRIPAQYIIPKTALLTRQGRSVVFTWANDTALWNYVEVGLENSDQLSIRAGLKPSAIVITSGHLNLAHKSPVQILKRP